MAYRNGTYAAFHANGETDPTKSDMKYYRLLIAWHENDSVDFRMTNSHEKTSAVRDTSKPETLAAKIRERLNQSRNMVLVIGETTKTDDDWVPFEIAYAIDKCKIPVIAAYPGGPNIQSPSALSARWPTALRSRIDDKTAHVIHVPFRREPIKAAIKTFDQNNYPKGGGLGYYILEAYEGWGLT